MCNSSIVRFDGEENLERQRNEIMALASIYCDGEFTVLPHLGQCYRVKLEVDVPGPFWVREPNEGWLFSSLNSSGNVFLYLTNATVFTVYLQEYGRGGRCKRIIRL